MNIILAIDIGTKTGWACNYANGHVVSGMEDFSNNRFSGGGMRYLRFRRWLNEMHTSQGINEIVYEEVRRHAGTTAAHVYGGFLAVLTSYCEEHSIPYDSETVQGIKKFWTGKGNAGKPLMIATAVEKGFNVTDDSEADAIALLHLQISKISSSIQIKSSTKTPNAKDIAEFISLSD